MGTIFVSRQGWCPKDNAALNRVVRRDGAAAWHHLRSLYLIPVGPGADELEVLARLNMPSSSEISSKGWGLWAGGLSGCMGGMGRGMEGKKCSERTVWMSRVEVSRVLLCFRRGGMLLTHQPWCHLVTIQSLSAVVWSRKSEDQACFALQIVRQRSFIATEWDSPLVVATHVRAASQ